MKRLVLACDGTWQDLSTECATNVVRFVQAVKPACAKGIAQIVHYDGGVGAEETGRKVTGGALGKGLDRAILDAYRFLALNWEDGDELTLLGFSRGAYTVRSLCGLLRNSGLVRRHFLRKIPAAYELYRDREVKPEDAECRAFRRDFGREVTVDALCCFDTVGALGIPDAIPLLPFDEWLNARYRFHDTRLSRRIQRAFHALAIDESRSVFSPTLMQKSPHNPGQDLRQVWFVGSHDAVGGGTAALAPLSDISLQWLLQEMAAAGVGLETDAALLPRPLNPDPLHPFEQGGWLRFFGRQERRIVGGYAALHPSVVARWRADETYRPKPLAKLSGKLTGWG